MKSNNNYSIVIQPFSELFKSIEGVFYKNDAESEHMSIILKNPWPNNLVFKIIETGNIESLDYVVS